VTTTGPVQLTFELESGAQEPRQRRRATAPGFSTWLMAQPQAFDRRVPVAVWASFTKRAYITFCHRAGLDAHPATAPWARSATRR
jgi:hypothetical protein